MTDHNHLHETIEKYLNGQLEGEQLEAFRSRLAADEALRQEVALEKAVLRNLRTVGRADLRRQLEAIHQEMGPVMEVAPPAEKPLRRQPAKPNPALQLRYKRYLMLAAACLVLILATTLTLRNLYKSPETPLALFELYYEPYDNLAVMRGEASTSAIRDEAARAYNDKNYLRSIQLFKIVLEKGPDEEALFYLGNAYLSANMPLDAIQTFEAYLRDFEEYKFEAQWYLALSYLRTGKNQKAQNLLQDLSRTQAPDNAYQEKARELLDRYQEK
ncbi:MAG: hypothetical protein ACO1NZ_03195 [Adhaeribacter sp.]